MFSYIYLPVRCPSEQQLLSAIEYLYWQTQPKLSVSASRQMQFEIKCYDSLTRQLRKTSYQLLTTGRFDSRLFSHNKDSDLTVTR